MKPGYGTLSALWFAVVLKGFLPAILVYFLIVKPLVGAGYGIAYTVFYLVVFCPIAAVLMRPYLLRKRAETKKAEEEGDMAKKA